MKKCVQCRVPIDRMIPWEVCCGGQGSAIVVGAAASAFSGTNNLIAQNKIAAVAPPASADISGGSANNETGTLHAKRQNTANTNAQGNFSQGEENIKCTMHSMTLIKVYLVTPFKV